MKQFFLTLLVITGFAATSEARILTAVQNGAWSSNATWSPASTPTNMDTVIIPQTKTVSIISNENMNNSYLLLRVLGTLVFSGGGAKLKVSDQSAVVVYPGGQIQASNNSQTLEIGGVTALSGSNSGTVISGPMQATSSTAGFRTFTFNPLPVKFISFTAARRNNEALVQWSTAEEVDAYFYEIELSQDGRGWMTMGQVKAAGNSNIEQRYAFTLSQLAATDFYVRVKQVDLDGKFTYTQVRSLKAAAAAEAKISAYAGRVQVQFGQEVKGATLRIQSLSGQVLQEQKLASAFGQVSIPTAQKGICLVSVVSENQLVAAQKVLL